MTDMTEALKQIRAAMAALEKARDALSAELLAHKADGPEHDRIEQLHRKVTQAMALLPHGGER